MESVSGDAPQHSVLWTSHSQTGTSSGDSVNCLDISRSVVFVGTSAARVHGIKKSDKKAAVCFEKCHKGRYNTMCRAERMY